MGWIMLFVLVAVSFAALWLLGVRGGFLTAALAALMLGAAGYAFQGRPDLGGSPPQPSQGRDVQSLTEARHAFFGNFSAEESWLRMAEALARAGHTEDSVNLLQNAVRRDPNSAQLWVGLGNALVDHAHGLTPPAQFAFQRAADLAPGHPAPRFFHDLALARSGAGGPAVQDLIALMRENPKASWRPMVSYAVIAIALNGDRPRRQQGR